SAQRAPIVQGADDRLSFVSRCAFGLQDDRAVERPCGEKGIRAVKRRELGEGKVGMNGQGAAIRFIVRAQRGAALVVSAIMLVLITLFALAVINMSTANLRVANNEQIKAQSVASAQQAIEQVASTNFPANPQPTTVAVDINHDGSTDYNVAVAKPVCNNSVPIKLVELDITQS